MSALKTTAPILDKKTKIKNLEAHHKKTFSQLGVKNPFYSPKMAYFLMGERVISFFVSELEKEEDIYTEFVSRDYDSEDETRTLYKFKYNPHYKTEYKATEPHDANQSVRYIVPVAELHACIPSDDTLEEFDMPDPDQDLPIDQLTIRDLAAILTGKPVSMKKWLNEIVNNK